MEPCPRSSSAWRVREARGPVPQEAAFPSGQATPLASRRAALAKAGPFAYKTSHHGAWRSMVAHLLWEQGVAGSNPVAPTIKRSRGHTTMWCDLFLCKMAAPSRAVFFAMAEGMERMRARDGFFSVSVGHQAFSMHGRVQSIGTLRVHDPAKPLALAGDGLLSCEGKYK